MKWVSLLLLTACGWHHGMVAPEGGEAAQSIGIEIFGNTSLEPGLEADFAPFLSEAVVDFVNLPLAPVAKSDLVLRGTVTGYRRRNGIRSRNNKLLEGSARMDVSAELVRRLDGQVLKSTTTGLWTEYATGSPALTAPGVGEIPARKRLFQNLADRLVLELFDSPEQ